MDREEHEDHHDAGREADAEVQQGIAPERVFAPIVPDGCRLLAGVQRG